MHNPDIIELANTRRFLLRDIKAEESRAPTSDRSANLKMLYEAYDAANVAYVAAVERAAA